VGIASCVAFVKTVLDDLAMPGGAPPMAAYINAPDPNTQTTIPTAYVWPSSFDTSRDTVPRNLGPYSQAGAGFKAKQHGIDVFIVWMDGSNAADSDTIFPGIVDFAVAALETVKMPQLITDPYNGAVTEMVNLGEVIRGRIVASAVEDERFLRYDCLLNLPVQETYND
jgi:hypothetical protein